MSRPADARVDPAVLGTMERLRSRCKGAVAILSGRAIGQLDAFLAPLVLPAAGIHGLERRDASGRQHAQTIDTGALAAAVHHFEAFAAKHAGAICEPKSASVALHYRLCPEHEDAALELAGEIAGAWPALSLLRGKCVVELKAGKATKGDALAAFMREPPFSGRRPVVAGDDITDEAAFLEAARLGGIAIRIGAGDTAAGFRLASPEELHEWLARLVRRWDGEATQPDHAIRSSLQDGGAATPENSEGVRR